jgi:putative transposase
LNQSKAIEFERLTSVNTEVANSLLKIDKKERKKLTSAESFSLYKGRKGRIPLSVHPASYTEVLGKIISKTAKLGSLKLCKSKKGIWYALVSVLMEVPDAYQAISWIGVDRGQNNIAVAALPKGFGKFWKGGKIKNLRRRYQKICKSLDAV